jgi:hypothetical protein
MSPGVHVLGAWSPAAGTVERRLDCEFSISSIDSSIDEFIAELAIRRLEEVHHLGAFEGWHLSLPPLSLCFMSTMR